MASAYRRAASIALVLLSAAACRQVLGIEEPERRELLGDRRDIKLWTLSIDTFTSLTIKNPTEELVNLEGLTVFFDDRDEPDCAVLLPSLELAAAGSIRVHETPWSGDISAPLSCAEITLNPARAGAVYLCDGDCLTGSVIDYVAYTGSRFPTHRDPLPGASFSQPLPPIEESARRILRYQRVANRGSSPNYLNSDWAVERQTLFADFEEAGIMLAIRGSAPVVWTISVEQPLDVAVSTDVDPISNAASLRFENQGTEISTIVSYGTTEISTPRAISYFVRVDSETSAAQFELLGQSGLLIVALGFEETGLGASLADGRRIETPIAPSTWYQVELRNIDWTSGVYDLYVDRLLLRAGIPFLNAAPGVEVVQLYSRSGPSTVHFDAIEFWGQNL